MLEGCYDMQHGSVKFVGGKRDLRRKRSRSEQVVDLEDGGAGYGVKIDEEEDGEEDEEEDADYIGPASKLVADEQYQRGAVGGVRIERRRRAEAKVASLREVEGTRRDSAVLRVGPNWQETEELVQEGTVEGVRSAFKNAADGRESERESGRENGRENSRYGPETEEKGADQVEEVFIDLIEDTPDASTVGNQAADDSARGAEVDTEALFAFPPGLKGSIKLTSADYERLAPEKYLNDSIIDYYMKFVEMFATPPSVASKCYFFNSFFFKLLYTPDDHHKEINHSNVRRWTHEVDLFTKKYIFVPICSAFHWTLVIICNCGNLGKWEKDRDEPADRPIMLIYDSFLKSNVTHAYAKALKAYLQAEFESKNTENFERNGVAEFPDFSKMTTWMPRVPSQKNEFDCGLYLLQYIVSFLRDVPETFESKNFVNRPDWFSETDIEMLREHIRLLMLGQDRYLKQQEM